MIEMRQVNNPEGQVSFINLLKSSFLGKAYKRFLKPSPQVRSFVLWIWTTILPIFLSIYAKYKSGSYSLKKLSDYASDRQVLIADQLVKLESPKVFSENKSNIVDTQTEFVFPEVYIAKLTNAVVTGGSNFLYVDQHIICHDLFRCSHDYTSEELHYRFFINSKKMFVTSLSKFEATYAIGSGVVFTDATSGNYVHFLTEILPRVFLYVKEYPNFNTALIFDHGLHHNIMQAFRIVVGENRDLIELGMGCRLLVESLQVVSPCGYIPFQRRPNTKHLTDHSDGFFSPIVLGMMADFIKKSVTQSEQTSSFKKIFIRRNSEIRNISNAEDVENMLVAEGFVVIEPERLNFIEQVNIFSNAEVVVGATGAAFGNLIFCNTNAKIIILTSNYKNMIYGYWQSMAHAVGNKVTYVIGESVDVQSHLHSNFHINILDINDAIAS